MERGLVISPPLKIIENGNGFVIGSSDLDPQQLRFQLLFWDRLSLPKQSFLDLGLGAEAQYLQKEGTLSRTHVDVPGGLGGIIIAQAHYECFRKLEAAQPGRWSMANMEGDAEAIPAACRAEGRGVLVRLLNAIPVPDRDVPLDDVLKFKSKRKDELAALRVYLEDVFQRIIESRDPDLKLQTELTRLQASINDHVKVSREWGVKLKLADLTANLNVTGALASAFVSHSLGLTLLQSLATAMPAMLSIDIGVGLTGRKAASNPFRYISSIHKSLY
jgi:hypothetical protein